MFYKKISIIFIFFACLAPPLFAAMPKVETNLYGNTSYFWIDSSTTETVLKQQKTDPPETLTIYNLTQEVSSFDIKTENTKLYLVFAVPDPLDYQSNLYFTSSHDEGKSFSAPLLLSKGEKPYLSVNDDLLMIAWENDEKIDICHSLDGGSNFSPTKTLHITGEALSSPSLAIDSFDEAHLVFLSQDPNLELKKIKYSRVTPAETELAKPQTLFKSHDDLINLKIKNLDPNLLVFWQKEYIERREAYLAISLDKGQNFSMPLAFNFEKDLLDLTPLSSGKLQAVSYADSKALEQEIELPLLSLPQINSPTENLTLNTSNLKLIYSCLENNPFLAEIELSNDYDFAADNTWSFEQLISYASQEVFEYSFPIFLAEGSYFMRLYLLNGLTSSPFSQTIKFDIDNTPPQITSLEAKISGKNLTLKAEINESPFWLSINQLPASSESTYNFELTPGSNIFTLKISDEAGNITIATQEVLYDPACPEITMLSPVENDWFKSDSTIFIEANVQDLQEDIKEEAEAGITLDGEILEETLSYDASENKLSGFITLPPLLSDGTHLATIILADKAGNEGQVNFKINIDSTPPVLVEKPCFTNSQDSITLSLIDQGAGIDLAGSLVKISGVSLEGVTTQESEKLVLKTDLLLLEGSYEASIVARDKIGNIGDLTFFSVIVDLTPAEFMLIGTYEPETKNNTITIQGKVNELHPKQVKVYINQMQVEEMELAQDCFEKEIKLVPGNNRILVEVHDQAGNITSSEFEIFANIESTPTVLTDCENGPNPFSPQTESMYFNYTLTGSADLKIYVFNLTGTLIWKKEINNASSGNTSWNGQNQFGAQVSNGVYPYLICASSGNTREIRRGKIIVYK